MFKCKYKSCLLLINESSLGSIQEEPNKEPTKDIIKINNEQLERNTQPGRMAKQTEKECHYLASEQSSVTKSTRVDVKNSNKQLNSQTSDLSLTKMLPYYPISPNIAENARLLIKTNGPHCIEQEDIVEKFGFKIVTKELARSSYTSFYRVRYKGKSVILKKLLVNKLSTHNRDLLFNQSVKVMRALCCNCTASHQGAHFRYFVQIYELFLVRGTNDLPNDGVMLIFMEELKNRTINNRLKRVTRVKWKFVKRWAIQINSAISFMQERAVAHRLVSEKLTVAIVAEPSTTNFNFNFNLHLIVRQHYGS